MKDRMVIALVSISCITVLASVWTLSGHNHTTFSAAIGMIGTVTGYAFGQIGKGST